MSEYAMPMPHVEVHRGHRATIATAVYRTRGGDRISATGETVRHPDDREDPDVAEQLAVGRALEALARKLLRRADGLVRHHEHNRTEKAEAGPVRCIALTAQGMPCRRPPRHDDVYCASHGA